MPHFNGMPRIVAAGALCLSAGCYSMQPYGPQPYGSQPGMYAPAPGQPVFTTPTLTVPPSTYVMPGEGSGAAPGTAAPSSPAPETPATDHLVPRPRDPAGAKAVPAGQQTSQTTHGTFSLPASAQAQLEAAAAAPVRAPGTSVRTARQPVDHGQQHVVAVSHQDPSQTVPFAHDSKHQWFQGIVEFDQEEQAWHLLYDPRPSDELGGDITLGGRAAFTAKDAQRVFRVYGVFDRVQLDRLGEPVYQVSHVELVE